MKDLKYPIPDQEELIDNFNGKLWHSVTDNCSGYTQLSIHPDCRDITAFDSPSGSRLRWKALPMGLSVAPALYALAMDHLVMKLKREKKIQNYFDDTHIGTETFEKHVEIMREYFELLREYDIKLNIGKSTFFQRKVTFLGLELDGKEVRIAEKRIKAIKDMPDPENKDDFRSSIGVFGYNRKFISHFSQKALPMLGLLKKDVEFLWGPEQQESFKTLKTDLSNPPALRLYNPKANNRICCDASYKGLGVAFYQQDPNTKRYHPVAFVSRKLTNSETKLPVYYLECAALVFAFVKFRCYLQNHNVDTEVLTDHQSLQSLRKTAKPEGVIAKYIMFLSQYKFTIKYRAGKTNIDADSLSRRPVDEPEKSVEELVDEFFPDQIPASVLSAVTTRAQLAKEKIAAQNAKVLDEENKKDNASNPKFMPFNDVDIMKYLQEQDSKLAPIITNLKSTGPNTKYRGFVLRNALLYVQRGKKFCFVVPDSCRKYILQEFHDNRGHRAPKHLIQNIVEHFWWNSIHQDSQLYYDSCRYCMLHSNNPKDKPGFFAPVISKRPFAHISCDFVGMAARVHNKPN